MSDADPAAEQPQQDTAAGEQPVEQDTTAEEQPESERATDDASVAQGYTAEQPQQEPAADAQPVEPDAAAAEQAPQEPTSEGQAPGQDATEPPADLSHLKAVVEALLFSTDRPVSSRRLTDASGAADGHQVRRVLQELKRQYDEGGHAFALEEIAGGFQILTRPEFGAWIGRLNTQQRQETLSKAALETLAVVAYRQPITRAEVDDIRGVQAGPLLRALAGRRLIKVVGRSEELGRPLLYGTTKHFLEVFGLRSIKDLPKRADFAKLAAARPSAAQAETEAEPEQEPPGAEHGVGPEPESEPEIEPESDAELEPVDEAEPAGEAEPPPAEDDADAGNR